MRILDFCDPREEEELFRVIYHSMRILDFDPHFMRGGRAF